MNAPLHIEADSASLRSDGERAELCLHQAPCNEIGLGMLAALEQAVEALDAHGADLRTLVIHSDQRGFCAGADLRELYSAIAGREPEAYAAQLSDFIDRIHGVMNALDSLPLTTIGAVSGVCFGGGFELALTCDILVADRSARFCFPELRLGLIPGFGGIPRLRRDLPNAVVRDLILTGRSLGARRASELGLVSQLVARGEALTTARACAQQAALFPQAARKAALGFMKPIPRQELEEEKRLFLALFQRAEVQEALAEFVARRDPMPYQPKGDAT